MKNIHGTFYSFKELGEALDIKSKTPKTEKARKCPNCGGTMRKVAENVWVCPFSKIEDKKLGDADVQVFEVCGNQLIIDPFVTE